MRRKAAKASKKEKKKEHHDRPWLQGSKSTKKKKKAPDKQRKTLAKVVSPSTVARQLTRRADDGALSPPNKAGSKDTSDSKEEELSDAPSSSEGEGEESPNRSKIDGETTQGENSPDEKVDPLRQVSFQVQSEDRPSMLDAGHTGNSSPAVTVKAASEGMPSPVQDSPNGPTGDNL